MSERTPAPIPGAPACFGPANSLMGLVGAGLRVTSAEVYRRDVADFLAWWDRDPAEATGADIVRYVAERRPTPAGADRRLAALAHFYRGGIRAGHWSHNPVVGLARARRGAWRSEGRR